MDYGSYSDEEKGKKKGGANDPYADGQADNGEGYDNGESQDGSKNGKKKSNKMIWVWSGVAAIVLILILLAIYWFWVS